MNERQAKGEHGTCETVEIDGVVYNKHDAPVQAAQKETEDDDKGKAKGKGHVVESTGSASGKGGQK